MNTTRRILLFLLLNFLFTTFIFGQHLRKNGQPDRRYKENRTSHSYKSPAIHHYSGMHRTTYAYGVARDKNGKIKRSESARHLFMRQTGYPHGRRGYVIDHIIPLKRGG